MTNAEMVKAYDAKLEGQLLLFPDDDIILRKTKFKEINPEFDKMALIHWWMNIYLPEYHTEEEHTPYEIYNTWSSAVYKYFHYTTVNMGYNPKTNQQGVKFMGYLKEPVEEQKKELELWLPYIKPYKDENGRLRKRISIMEKDLSEHGSWSLCVFSDTEYVLGVSRWHRYEETTKFDCLGKAVWFIANHRWYEKRKEK